MEIHKYYSIPEVADLTGLHPSMLRRWVRDGHLAAVRNGRTGHMWLRIEDVTSLLDRLTVPARHTA